MLTDADTDRLAWAILAVLALGLLAWLYRDYRRTSYTPAQLPLYMLNRFLACVRWRTAIKGVWPISPNQPALIVSNHRGPIDPGIIALVTPRPVRWMVAREYFSWPLFGWALRVLAAIPTGRAGIDTAAVRTAMRAAAEGELVGMFPEGRINRTAALLLAGRPGAALVALKTRVPVVPCYLENTPDDGTAWGFLFVATRARLVIGQPIDLSPWFGREHDKAAQAEVTRLLLREIARLAGEPDYPVEVTQRPVLVQDNGSGHSVVSPLSQ